MRKVKRKFIGSRNSLLSAAVSKKEAEEMQKKIKEAGNSMRETIRKKHDKKRKHIRVEEDIPSYIEERKSHTVKNIHHMMNSLYRSPASLLRYTNTM